MIHVDLNLTNSIQPIPSDPTNIGSIHVSTNIHAKEKILASTLHYTVPSSPIFLYVSASEPPKLSHESPEVIVTPKEITKPRNKPPNLVLYVPADSDSNTSLSNSSSSEPYDSSDDEYYERRICAENNKKKLQSKTRFDDLIKKYANITAKILTAVYKSKVTKFK